MTEPLDLEPIWERLAGYRFLSSADMSAAADDVASLLLEVERLRSSAASSSGLLIAEELRRIKDRRS